MTGHSGIFTNVIAYLRRIWRAMQPMEYDEGWAEWDALGDRFRLPRQWIVCEHCGAHCWRLPPHGVEPCPTVLSMSEAAGLKLDAERSTTIRAGLHMESMMQAMQDSLGDDEEDE